MPQREKNDRRPPQDVVCGRNAVMELLRSGRELETLFVAKGERRGSIAAVLALAREKGVPIKECDVKKLDFYAGGTAHQGVAALPSAVEYTAVEDILRLAEERGEPPFLVLADGIEDPHNLGAIIRTAECAGAHGIVIPKRRSAGVTAAVHKASAGAASHLPIARVANLAAVIEGLKEKGVWIYGADMTGTPHTALDYTGPTALVIGSEGAGISRLVREKCDFIATLPMRGKINSLNASVAAAVLLYEVVRQRNR